MPRFITFMSDGKPIILDRERVLHAKSVNNSQTQIVCESWTYVVDESIDVVANMLNEEDSDDRR